MPDHHHSGGYDYNCVIGTVYNKVVGCSSVWFVVCVIVSVGNERNIKVS